MNKLVRKMSVILVLVGCFLACTSCKKCSKCSDRPLSFTDPAISNPDLPVLKIGKYVITKNEVYNQLLNSYGVETLMNIIDDNTLPEIKDQQAFDEYLDTVIYGDEEKTDEVLNKFLESLPVNGLSTDKNAHNYYVKYYELVYRRKLFAKNNFIADMKEDTFTEEQLKNHFEEKYRKNNDLIIIRFDSKNEANYYLSKYDIDLNYLNTGWQKTDGTKLTNTQILSLFETIAQDRNMVSTAGVKTYTYDELEKINKTLASTVYNWSNEQYTKVPTAYSGTYYLIYKANESKNLDANGNEVTYEAKQEEIKDSLIDATITTAYSSQQVIENEIKHDLKIYDEGLEIFYEMTYNSVYKSLGYSTDEYDAYKRYDKNDKKIVFSYQKDGQKVNVTADEMYDLLMEQYGTYLLALYLRQYAVISNSSVYDIVNDVVLDQTKYDLYYEKDIKPYKESFEDNAYEALGFSKLYGWNNFVKDYLGLLSDTKVLINLDSTMYTEELENYKHALYLYTTAPEGQTLDQKIQDEMENVFKNYFNLTAAGVSAYYDRDLDNIADEVVAGSEDEQFAKELIALIHREVAKQTGDTATAIKKLVQEYNTTNKDANTIWKPYKAKGLRLKVIASTTYSRSSSANETVLNQLKKQFDSIMDYTTENGLSISGQDFSKPYTFTRNDTKYTIKSTDFTNLEEDIITIDNVLSCYFVTKFIEPYYINKTKQEYKPTLQQYNSYKENKKNVETAVANCITTYYVPAINNVVSSNDVNLALMDECLKLLETAEHDNKTALVAYIELCKKLAEDEKE